MPLRDWRVRANDIVEAAKRAQSYVMGLTFDQFKTDSQNVDATSPPTGGGSPRQRVGLAATALCRQPHFGAWVFRVVRTRLHFEEWICSASAVQFGIDLSLQGTTWKINSPHVTKSRRAVHEQLTARVTAAGGSSDCG